MQRTGDKYNCGRVWWEEMEADDQYLYEIEYIHAYVE